jgi:hypothetical protein
MSHNYRENLKQIQKGSWGLLLVMLAFFLWKRKATIPFIRSWKLVIMVLDEHGLFCF